MIKICQTCYWNEYLPLTGKEQIGDVLKGVCTYDTSAKDNQPQSTTICLRWKAKEDVKCSTCRFNVKEHPKDTVGLCVHSANVKDCDEIEMVDNYCENWEAKEQNNEE